MEDCYSEARVEVRDSDVRLYGVDKHADETWSCAIPYFGVTNVRVRPHEWDATSSWLEVSTGLKGEKFGFEVCMGTREAVATERRLVEAVNDHNDATELRSLQHWYTKSKGERWNKKWAIRRETDA